MWGNKTAILIACFNWYPNRLKYIDIFLKTRGYETTILLSDYNHATKHEDLTFLGIENVKYINTMPYRKNISAKRLISHYRFSDAVCRIVKKNRPTLVYALIPPNSLSEKLAKMKRQADFQLIFDIIDLWPESFPKGNTNFFPFKIWRRMRDNYLEVADHLVLECDYYKNIINPASTNKGCSVLYLVKEPLKIDNSKVVTERDLLTLAYLGSINSLIDVDRISRLVTDLVRLKPVHIKIIGDGERRTEFIRRMELAGAKVSFYGKVFDDLKKCELFADCDMGINVYKQGLKIGLTLKSVDYFQMGLPILNSIPGDTEDIVSKYGVGVNVDSISAKYILEYAAHRDTNKRNVEELFKRMYSSETINERLGFLNSFI